MTDAAAPNVVIDSNVLLDLWVYADPRCDTLRAAIDARAVRICGTLATREELQHVLAYPHIAARLARDGRCAETVLAHYDADVSIHAVAPKAPYTCKDADDQKFIDLAVALQCPLISKDQAVLTMKNRLARLGVMVSADPSLHAVTA